MNGTRDNGTPTPAAPKTVLVTGATGYIGGRLVPRLLEAGHTVKVLVRTPAKIAGVPWLADVEVIHGSLDDGAALRGALDGVDVLYYLVHSMAAGPGFESKEKAMAGIAATAATDAGVGRIIYLGGLHPANAELSTHMRSREAVGKIFLDGPVDAVVFQAGVVIGSGSASFEMIRHLAETLPVMPAPNWVKNRIEAIAVRDVLHYLVAAASLDGTINRTFDIGCRQVLTYAEMMKEYAAEAGLPRRLVLALPVPAPKLAGMWVALTTPIPLSMSLPLVESLQHDAVSREHDIDSYIPLPEGGLTPYRRAVALALAKERDGQVETTWASAGADADPLPSDPDWAGHRVYLDERSYSSPVDLKHVWTIIEGIGGRNGWYSLPLAWRVRGWLDKLTGGAGLLRGRRHPHLLAEGEVVDWWRVERVDRGRLLRLRAEMRAPGRAWLELSVEPDGTGSRYRQRAIFFPKGLSGRLYWLAVLPFHSLIFPAMSRNITAAARGLQELESESAGHTPYDVWSPNRPATPHGGPPMSLSASTTVPHSVDRVTAVFVNEDFLRHTSELVGGTLESFAVDGDTAGAFSTTTVRTIPTTRMPEIARKFVGESLKVTQLETWDAPAADGSRQSKISLKIGGAPLDVSAVQRLVSDGGSTRIELEGTVTSSVPFLGGKIADAAEPMVGKALNIQSTQAQAWLESH
ncbi:DUF2505 family protein [Arthrobacter sp. PAMC25564]|uniref:DUF2505 family protein n=1 Tax=Arthrobacter sp. PAMC25564 TaxID=2565366 RepID=UPI00197B385A|nr:DUF2505 family protein [Arthrobacter sp. PAMC25564]